MKIVAEQLDDAIQDQDNRNKCYEIQKELGNSFQIVEAHRRFIFEGELIKQCRKERKNRKFWIFNDIIIYGFYQPAILRYVLSRKLEMSALVISDIPDDPQNKIVNAIELNESSKSFLVFCKTFEDKVNWLVMLQNAIIENKQKKSTFSKIMEDEDNEKDLNFKAPVWIPDNIVDNCSLCYVKFTLVRRKHHCRLCGFVICDDCSENRIVLQNISKKPVRVCDSCFLKNNI